MKETEDGRTERLRRNRLTFDGIVKSSPTMDKKSCKKKERGGDPMPEGILV